MGSCLVAAPGAAHEFVSRMRAEYGRLDKTEMGVWECIELLNEFIDDSDPDLDWFHLTGLIHDLGKVLLHPSFGELPPWAVAAK